MAVNDFALLVGDVVVLQNLFAHIEVSTFDFALSTFDLARQQVVFDGNAAFGCKAVEDGGGTVEREETQQWIFKGEIEAAGAGVTLTAGTSAQLVVDTAAFVAFRTDDV